MKKSDCNERIAIIPFLKDSMDQQYLQDLIISCIIDDDAYEYISQCNNLFDLICMDIFVDDSIPGKFESFQFSEQLYKLLSNRGILIYNRLAEKETDNKKNNQYLYTYQ